MARESSPKALSTEDRRVISWWSADCAERSLPLFEVEAGVGDTRPREAIAGLRAFARGELRVTEAKRLAVAANAAARQVRATAAVTAALAAGQAAATAHMANHALGAAGYAATAAGLAASDDSAAVNEETRWQLRHLSLTVAGILWRLPPFEEPDVRSRGTIGRAIRDLQTELAASAPAAGHSSVSQ